ncbi:MAG: hypothetical protein ABFS86_04770 [Planctomycetota bacterium]
MSSSREGFLLIVVVNVVLSMAVVGAAFALFGSESDGAGPSGRPVGQEVEGLRAAVDNLRADLAKARAENEALRSEFSDVMGRVVSLEENPAGPGTLLTSGGKPVEISKQMRMMIGLADTMMRSRVKGERDRFLDEVLNPTESSEARKKRRVDRAVRHLKNRVGLTEEETKDVSKILLDLENNRRAALKSLLETKESKDDVEYYEVQRILEDSFVEEDRQIMATLPPEKVESYQETAEPFREMIFGMAKMAFPEKKEGE